MALLFKMKISFFHFYEFSKKSWGHWNINQASSSSPSQHRTFLSISGAGSGLINSVSVTNVGLCPGWRHNGANDHPSSGGCLQHIVTTRSTTQHRNIETYTLLPFSNFLEINRKHPLLSSIQHLINDIILIWVFDTPAPHHTHATPSRCTI